MNPGRIILRNLKASEGIAYGHLYAVHPKEETIDGDPLRPDASRRCRRRSTSRWSRSPPRGRATRSARSARAGRAESIILIPGGFAETGKRATWRRRSSPRSRPRARGPDGGPVLVGGNCLGIVSKRQYNTFFLPQYKLPFHDAPGDNLVAISQSGAYLVSLTSNLDGIIFPRASISYGNQMDLTVADFLEYFLRATTSVQVLACYVEGFKPLDGERFVALARELRARGRRVIAFKAGKTRAGRQGGPEPHRLAGRRLRGRPLPPGGRRASSWPRRSTCSRTT